MKRNKGTTTTITRRLPQIGTGKKQDFRRIKRVAHQCGQFGCFRRCTHPPIDTAFSVLTIGFLLQPFLSEICLCFLLLLRLVWRGFWWRPILQNVKKSRKPVWSVYFLRAFWRFLWAQIFGINLEQSAKSTLVSRHRNQCTTPKNQRELIQIGAWWQVPTDCLAIYELKGLECSQTLPAAKFFELTSYVA